MCWTIRKTYFRNRSVETHVICRSIIDFSGNTQIRMMHRICWSKPSYKVYCKYKITAMTHQHCVSLSSPSHHPLSLPFLYLLLLTTRWVFHFFIFSFSPPVESSISLSSPSHHPLSLPFLYLLLLTTRWVFHFAVGGSYPFTNVSRKSVLCPSASDQRAVRGLEMVAIDHATRYARTVADYVTCLFNLRRMCSVVNINVFKY